MHAYDPSTEEIEAEGSEVQGRPQLYSKFKACMGYMRPFLKRRTDIGELAAGERPERQMYVC